MQKNMCGYLLLGTLIFIVDRITKMMALAWCAEKAYTVNSFLSFDLLFNRGVSWGMLHSASDIVFLLVSLIIACITAALCWYAYYSYTRGLSVIGEVCIIAGSFSNLIDRALYSGVIDFILFSYGSLSWPVFNIADAAIVLGVGIVFFQYEK